ncbi:hypothetical protein T492DRAFT_1012481 [Pavlovales sp. CCMP2436]|nr:hypothetical protein T492DRAFT_1012481 [Pavlovales sp. CCMP2436]
MPHRTPHRVSKTNSQKRRIRMRAWQLQKLNPPPILRFPSFLICFNLLLLYHFVPFFIFLCPDFLPPPPLFHFFYLIFLFGYVLSFYDQSYTLDFLLANTGVTTLGEYRYYIGRIPLLHWENTVEMVSTLSMQYTHTHTNTQTHTHTNARSIRN